MTLLLLPPSETKRDGGVPRSRLALSRLGYPVLTELRASMLDQLAAVSADDETGTRALRISARAASIELERNRQVRSSATLPALERYTGVLYDALAVEAWSEDARRRAAEHVVIQSALFGLLRADDPIPAYRLSHDARLPDVRLVRHWADPIARILARRHGPVLDLRSEAYSALGPIPERDDARFVRVVAAGDDGVTRALSHANKSAKGRYLRALLESGSMPTTLDGLVARSADLGWILRPGAPGELDLVVPRA